jgi:hypothetical protein
VCTVCVPMCAGLLPPGVNSTAAICIYHHYHILKSKGTMKLGFRLPKAGNLVGLSGVLSNAIEDSRLLRLCGMSTGKMSPVFQ